MGWDGWDLSQTTTTTRAPLAVLKIQCLPPLLSLPVPLYHQKKVLLLLLNVELLFGRHLVTNWIAHDLHFNYNQLLKAIDW